MLLSGELFYISQEGNGYQFRLKDVYPHFVLCTAATLEELKLKIRVFIRRYKTVETLLERLRKRCIPVMIPAMTIVYSDALLEANEKVFGPVIEEIFSQPGKKKFVKI